MAEKHRVVFPKCCIVSTEDQAAIHQLLQTYYKSLAGHLLKAHKDLQNREKQNRQTLMVLVTWIVPGCMWMIFNNKTYLEILIIITIIISYH